MYSLTQAESSANAFQLAKCVPFVNLTNITQYRMINVCHLSTSLILHSTEWCYIWMGERVCITKTKSVTSLWAARVMIDWSQWRWLYVIHFLFKRDLRLWLYLYCSYSCPVCFVKRRTRKHVKNYVKLYTTSEMNFGCCMFRAIKLDWLD